MCFVVGKGKLVEDNGLIGEGEGKRVEDNGARRGLVLGNKEHGRTSFQSTMSG